MNAQQELDQLNGLWATDRPDLIPSNLKDVFFRIGYPKEDLAVSQAQQTESKQGCKECDGQTYMHSPTGEYLGECPYCTKEQEPYAYELKLV